MQPLPGGQALAVVAGNDINSLTAVDTATANVQDKGRKHSLVASTSDQTVKGSQFTAGGNIALQAGNDITLQAATVVSEQGGIGLAAGRDVNLTAAHEEHTTQTDASKKKSGTFSTTKTTTHDATQDSYAIGTTLSGDRIAVAAGRDITTQAAQVAATHDVVLAAGRDLTIGTATSTHSEQHDKTSKKSGIYSSGGFNITAGQSKTAEGFELTQTTPEGSLIGSTDGKVTLSAGNKVHITGSDVLSHTETAIVGKNVTIDAAVGTTDTKQTYKQQSAGIHLGLTGGVVSAVEAAYGAAKRGDEVQDDRLKALYAAKAVYAIKDSAADIAALANGGSAADAGISLRIGIGASSASSQTTTHDDASYGSSIRSNGNVAIAATGGDLNIIGSEVDAKNVALAASNDINLLSQSEQHRSDSKNKNGSAEIGVSVGSTTGFYVTANAGKGKANGNGVTHAETTINAGNTLSVVSGNNTTIQGAQLTGKQVLANIGGNLRIESEQDTDDYASKQQQAGGTFVYGSGGSVNFSQQKTDSTYASVKEQSGIAAGEGGFQITVGGNTHLKGGVIASTADASKNTLSTGSLTAEDIQNRASYEASSVGVGGSGGGGGGFSASPSLGVPQSEDASSTTKAGISAGSIDIRNGDNTALASIDRSVTSLQQDGLKPIFDEQKVQETLELGQVAGEVGMRAAGDLAGKVGWKEGSKERALLHGAVGAAIAALGGGNAIQGLAGAAVSQLTTVAMQGYLRDNDIDPNSPEGKSLMELGSLAVGAAVGGGSGAATALAGEQFNRQLHPDEEEWVKQNAKSFAQQVCNCSNPSPEEIQNAQNKLMAQAFTLVDENAVRLSQDNAEWNGYFDNQAADYLFDNPVQFAWGQGFVPDEHFSDPHYNGDLLASNPDAFRNVMNGMILGSNVPRVSLQETYSEEFLRWGGAQVGESGRQVIAVVGGSAAAGGGAALVTSGVAATGVMAVRGVWDGLPSLVQAGLGGAGSGGFWYTTGVAGGAAYDTVRKDQSFGSAYRERFSWAGFTSSAAVGAVGGVYVRQMLTWAGLPYGIVSGWKTAGGAVVNANKFIATQAVNRAANSAIETHSDESQEGGGKP